jgi:hypothetical protein
MKQVGARQVGYTPGQFYRRFYGTNAQRMTRRAVESQSGQLAMLGSALFGQAVEQSMGLSELAAKQVVKRVQSSAADIGKTLDKLKLASGKLNLIA